MKLFQFIRQLFSFRKGIASLTIVGVGPGDPSLLTIEAAKALKHSKVIFYPTSGVDKISYSKEIVKDFIKFKKKIPLVFPMGRKEYNSKLIWKSSAEKIVFYLNKNISVALICLGDTSIYASSFNICDEIKKNFPEIKIKIIPGISSFSYAAALSDFQLIKQGESLEVCECPNDSYAIKDLINKKHNKVLVIMKIGKRWQSVKGVLEEENLLSKTLLAYDLCMKNQFIGNASECFVKELPYFSLLLIRP